MLKGENEERRGKTMAKTKEKYAFFLGCIAKNVYPSINKSTRIFVRHRGIFRKVRRFKSPF